MSTGRPANILRPTRLTTTLPEDVRAKLDIHLYSTVEGRIPVGAYSKFLSERVREFFEPKAVKHPPTWEGPAPLMCPTCNRPISEHNCP